MNRPFKRPGHGDNYYIRYYDPAKGYTVTESAGTTNEKKAEVVLRNRLGSKDKNEPIISNKVRRTTMKQLFDAVVTDYKNNKQRSIDKVKRMFKKYIEPVFAHRRAISVTRLDLENYKSSRCETASKATVNRELSAVRRSFKHGMRLGLIASMPDFKGLLMDESDNVREGFFELPEFLKHYAHLPWYAQPISEMGYTFGQRLQELLSLKLDQVDRVNCIITLSAKQTKNKKIRRIHYGKNPAIKELIEKQFERKVEIESKSKRHVKITTLFFHADGRPVKNFRGAWKTACEKSGVTRTFHDLRRTAIRNMIRAGIAEKVAMQISGHTTRSVFDRYNITSPGDLELAGSKIGVNFQLSSTVSSTQTSADSTETKTETNSVIDFPTTKQ